MGVYGSVLLPRLIDLACGAEPAGALRRRVCTGLSGRVVEIGFGSGHNVPFYPHELTQVSAVEPNDTAWKLSAKRRAASPVPVLRAGLDGQSLPFPNASFDAAVSTWTLCTIPDAAAALAELRRVLVPGGSLHFLEHGLAPDADVRVWQHRLEPLQKKLVGGCHLTRRPVQLLQNAGFVIEGLDVFYEEKAPRFLAADSLGTAVSP